MPRKLEFFVLEHGFLGAHTDLEHLKSAIDRYCLKLEEYVEEEEAWERMAEEERRRRFTLGEVVSTLSPTSSLSSSSSSLSLSPTADSVPQSPGESPLLDRTVDEDWKETTSSPLCASHGGHEVLTTSLSMLPPTKGTGVSSGTVGNISKTDPSEPSPSYPALRSSEFEKQTNGGIRNRLSTTVRKQLSVKVRKSGTVSSQLSASSPAVEEPAPPLPEGRMGSPSWSPREETSSTSEKENTNQVPALLAAEEGEEFARPQPLRPHYRDERAMSQRHSRNGKEDCLTRGTRLEKRHIYVLNHDGNNRLKCFPGVETCAKRLVRFVLEEVERVVGDHQKDWEHRDVHPFNATTPSKRNSGSSQDGQTGSCAHHTSSQSGKKEGTMGGNKSYSVKKSHSPPFAATAEGVTQASSFVPGDEEPPVTLLLTASSVVETKKAVHVDPAVIEAPLYPSHRQVASSPHTVPESQHSASSAGSDGSPSSTAETQDNSATLPPLAAPTTCTIVFHVLGYSMGGLVVRAALPALMEGVEQRFCREVPGSEYRFEVQWKSFLSISSPHVGSSASHPQGRWTYNVAAFLRRMCLLPTVVADMMLHNHYIEEVLLSDRHVTAVKRFEKKIFFALTNDRMVWNYSSAFFLPPLERLLLEGWKPKDPIFNEQAIPSGPSFSCGEEKEGLPEKSKEEQTGSGDGAANNCQYVKYLDTDVVPRSVDSSKALKDDEESGPRENCTPPSGEENRKDDNPQHVLEPILHSSTQFSDHSAEGGEKGVESPSTVIYERDKENQPWLLYEEKEKEVLAQNKAFLSSVLGVSPASSFQDAVTNGILIQQLDDDENKGGIGTEELDGVTLPSDHPLERRNWITEESWPSALLPRERGMAIKFLKGIGPVELHIVDLESAVERYLDRCLLREEALMQFRLTRERRIAAEEAEEMAAKGESVSEQPHFTARMGFDRQGADRFLTAKRAKELLSQGVRYGHQLILHAATKRKDRERQLRNDRYALEQRREQQQQQEDLQRKMLEAGVPLGGPRGAGGLRMGYLSSRRPSGSLRSGGSFKPLPQKSSHPYCFVSDFIISHVIDSRDEE